MQTMVHEAKGRITMKITEKNYIQQLQLHNEEALIYVIDMYGGLRVIGQNVLMKTAFKP